jgi:DNA-binding CsgD family transcriptional regulator
VKAPHAVIEGRCLPSSRSSDHLRVLIVSESVVLRAGMYALLRDQSLMLVEPVPDLEQLPFYAAAKRAQAALVAPVDRFTTKLHNLLTHQSLPLRMVLLLPPVALKIHSETLRLFGNVHCLPLQAPRGTIIQALIGLTSRPETGLFTERVSRGPGGRLTPRQQEVLDCLARGFRNCEIATQLAITEDTVKAHLGAIYRKLGVKSRAEAITAYLEAI